MYHIPDAPFLTPVVEIVVPDSPYPASGAENFVPKAKTNILLYMDPVSAVDLHPLNMRRPLNFIKGPGLSRNARRMVYNRESAAGSRLFRQGIIVFTGKGMIRRAILKRRLNEKHMPCAADFTAAKQNFIWKGRPRICQTVMIRYGEKIVVTVGQCNFRQTVPAAFTELGMNVQTAPHPGALLFLSRRYVCRPVRCSDRMYARGQSAAYLYDPAPFRKIRRCVHHIRYVECLYIYRKRSFCLRVRILLRAVRMECGYPPLDDHYSPGCGSLSRVFQEVGGCTEPVVA